MEGRNECSGVEDDDGVHYILYKMRWFHVFLDTVSYFPTYSLGQIECNTVGTQWICGDRIRMVRDRTSYQNVMLWLGFAGSLVLWNGLPDLDISRELRSQIGKLFRYNIELGGCL